MKAELQEKEVLAMYDVRGIQNYIFKSNVAKEIIGASALVEKIVTGGLQKYIEGLDAEVQKNYMIDWENDDDQAFLKNQDVMMQVMFVGGGNAYVLFRKGSECQKVNQFLGKYILDATYSLNLSIAVIEKTDSYNADYNKINLELRKIKAYMSLTQPMGALPFMAADTITGYPITGKDSKKSEYLCTEAKLKRRAFPEQESEKVFDRMVSEKGDNSLLAVVHMDGNQMGIQIQEKMSRIGPYEDAIPAMRKISKEIAVTFRDTFDRMLAYMDELAPKVKKNVRNKLYREIVVAGDDITFVCNAKLAIPAVKFFLENIGADKNYSACGGIAFFNSHFPFSDAYQVAEACCDSAKKRAKQKSCRGKNNEVGNFLDFQMCTNIRAARLDSYREKHYLTDGEYFIARPYFIPAKKDRGKVNAKNKKYSIERMEQWSEVFSHMPRSKAKQLRNIIPMGKNEIEKTLSFLASRGYKTLAESQEEYQVWYDALELMDLYIGGDENEIND